MPATVPEGVPPQPAASQPPALPLDSLLDVFKLLEPSSLHAASGVCASWRAASEIDAGELWQRLGAACFGERLAAPGVDPLRRVAAPSGVFVLAQPELLRVRTQFEQRFSPTELAAARGEFIAGAAPPDTCSELGGWWKRRFFAFGAALRHDPWAGAPVRDAGLKCSVRLIFDPFFCSVVAHFCSILSHFLHFLPAVAQAAEASSVAHGREHVCSSPLQQLRDHARHVIPHGRWAACTQCARVVCDDCVNSGEFCIIHHSKDPRFSPPAPPLTPCIYT